MKFDYENAAGEGRAHEPCAANGAPRVAIVVCSSCRDETGSDVRPRPGEKLAEDAERAAGAEFPVERVECLGNCKRRLSAAIVKDGGWTYVFGDLTATSGADLVEGARLLAHSADGLMPWRGRPQSLKQGLVARIPPVFSRKDFCA